MITIEPTTAEHIQEVIANLREHDKPTFAHTGNPVGTLRDIVRRSSESYVGLLDGKLLCMWGITARTILQDTVYMWMVSTPLAEKHSLVFARRAIKVIKEVLEEYGEVEGNVVAWNDIAIKWVTWLGAELIETGEVGVFKFRLGRNSFCPGSRKQWVLKH